MTDIESVKNAQRLHHILQAVQRIHRSVGELSYEMFMADEDKQGNVVRCLEIIGEAANHVSEERQSEHAVGFQVRSICRREWQLRLNQSQIENCK